MILKQRSDNQNTVIKRSDASMSKTLASGLAILEFLSRKSEPMGVRELSREMNMNPAQVQRLLNTLSDCGFVEKDMGLRRYRVGLTAFQVGRAYLADTGLVDAAAPILRDVSDRVSVNTYLAVRRGDVSIYIFVHLSQGALSVHAVPGNQMPLHSTAMGKALLSALTDNEIRQLLGAKPLPRITEATETDLEKLIEEVRQIREGDVAIADEENIPGIFSAGAPVRDTDGDIIAAVSCACAVQMTAGDGRKRIEDEIRQAAERISRRLGAPASVSYLR